MAEEFFGGISLNLDPTPAHRIKKKTADKVVGNLRSRIKQRREIKREKAEINKTSSKQEDDKSVTAVDSGGSVAKSKKRKTSEISGKDQGGDGGKRFGKHRKTDGIISSLFKSNPEIPLVESSVVNTVSEEVFTGNTFRELPIHPYMISNLEEKLGFTELTQIQQKAIPVLLKRKDALIKSQTGSGKTLAYAVPIVQTIQSFPTKSKREDGPFALVIVPTRELAIQTYDIFVKLLRSFIWIVPGCLMGGEKRKAEKSRLRKGVNILVTTPGRLLDHINTTNVLSLARIHWLVIDEADRLLELGYERDVAQILNALKSQCPDHNTVLLSATLSEGVERLSSITLRDPTHISINPGGDKRTLLNNTQGTQDTTHMNDTDGKSGEGFSVPSELNQFFIVAPGKLRLVTLSSFILWKCRYSSESSKMIVFMSTQHMVHFHYQLFNKVLNKNTVTSSTTPSNAQGNQTTQAKTATASKKKSTPSLCFYQLHGEMRQKERTDTFRQFSKAKRGILLCTDVAARGLDLPSVDWIIQYTLPGQMVDYIHRIGRTARAGSQGQSLLFLLPSEVDYVQELNKNNLSLEQTENTKMLRKLLSNIKEFHSDHKTLSPESTRQIPRTIEEAATFLQDRFEEILRKDQDLLQLAAKGFQSYIRAYSTYSKEVKAVLKAKELHLGHVAKSFGLREAPSEIHGISAKVRQQFIKNKKEQKKNSILARHRPLSFKQATLSEYASGIPAGKKKSKPYY